MEEYFAALTVLITRWGAAIVFLAMFLEAIPVVGFAMPGLTILVLTGFLSAGTSDSVATAMFSAALAGLILSDTAAYWLGIVGVTRSKRIGRLLEKRQSLRAELARQRPLVLVWYQFPPYTRMFAPLLLGAAGLPWRRWWPLVGLGSLAFVSAFFFLGRAAGLAGRQLAGAMGVAEQVSGLFVLALFAWLIVIGVRVAWRWRRRPVDRSQPAKQASP